jgi:hypothetical protein
MKRLLTSCSVFAVLMIGLFAVSAAQKGANFAGTWELDKAKSQGLGQGMQNATSVTWIVTQDDKQLTREQKIEGGQGGPGGGGMGPQTFKLDGTETTTDVQRISGKSTTKAKWSDGGKILELNSVTSGKIQEQDFKSTTTEHWELAEGGKMLQVHRKSEGPRGASESTMVFNKK